MIVFCTGGSYDTGSCLHISLLQQNLYTVGCHKTTKNVGGKYSSIQSFYFLSEQSGTMSESSRRLDNGALDGLRAIAVVHVMVRLLMT